MEINASLIGQAITFAILIWFTMKVVWPPLVRALDERSKTIADGLAAAEQGRQDMLKAEQAAATELEGAKQQSAEIVSQGEKRYAALIEEAKAASKIDADRIIANAKVEAEREIQRAKAELRDQVAALAVLGAEKILKREIDQTIHSDILRDLQVRL